MLRARYKLYGRTQEAQLRFRAIRENPRGIGHVFVEENSRLFGRLNSPKSFRRYNVIDMPPNRQGAQDDAGRNDV
jgi:hypothetical protein